MKFSTTREFKAELKKFKFNVQDGGTRFIQEAAQQAGEALVIGSQYGPGVPGPDTGFARASFRVGRNAAADGPTNPPRGLKGVSRGGSPTYRAALSTAKIARFQLGDLLYITTDAAYAIHLEDGVRTRRTGPSSNRGRSTQFVDPVVRSWDAIARDAERRSRFGELR
jgi:hypothetical protein